MGNQPSQNPQHSKLSHYQEVSRTTDGVIYRSRPHSSEEQSPEYFILKQHNYHNLDSCEGAYNKYMQAMNQPQEQQASTLAIREVVKEQMQHFCSNTFKIFVLYEYPELTLRDEIDVRAKESKFFEECQIVAILQTCVLALEEIKAVICFGSSLVYISPDGVIKVTHNDLVDENYRQLVTNGLYYAPQKLTNFTTESTSQLALKKQTIFSMGMTLLQACRLSSVTEIYDYKNHKINEQMLSAYIESLAERYSTEMIELLGNMLETNPNRRISLLEVQRALNRWDEMEEDGLNEEEDFVMDESEKQELENKCEKLFAYEGNALPRIKESNQSNEEPSIPNILSQQNSSRISLTKNPRSNTTINTADQFIYKLQKIIEPHQNFLKMGSHPHSDPKNMTAHFTQTPSHQASNESKDHLFTDPKLLQMIRKDLQQISKSRTSRVMYNSQQMNSSYVTTSQNVQNSITNRYNPGNYHHAESNPFNGSTFDKYTNSKKSFTEYATLHNCPQVLSLAASVAYDNTMSGQKGSYVYEESDVKRHPDDRARENESMKVSIALSSKNFALSKKGETDTWNQPQTVRYPLRQVSQNQHPAKSLSSVEQQIKSAMMKKKESNLVYLQELFEDGVKYEGMSKNGLKQGYGKLLYNDGAYFEGYFHNDKINGKGTLYYSKDRPAYDGEWVDEQFHGYGQLYNEQPEQLTEPFSYNNWNELENYWIKYEGEFQADLKHGSGKILLTSGECIEGQFEDDMLNGWATFYKANGNTVKGWYEHNKLVEIEN